MMETMKNKIKLISFLILCQCAFFGSTTLNSQESTEAIKSQEEIDKELEKELARIQEAYEEESLEELVPSEPLSADIAVSFPSDI